MPSFRPVAGYSKPFSPTQLEDELAWFTENAPTWNWKWASTFATSAPHSYVMKGQQLHPVDYERAVRLTLALGHPANFYRKTNIELHVPDLTVRFDPTRPPVTGVKFWPMSNRMTISQAFNIADITNTYGKQIAPLTATLDSRPTPFDLVAGDWEDLTLEGRSPYVVPLWKAICGDSLVDSLLEVGPSTGYAPDASLISKHTRYSLLGSSRGLLNAAVFKHRKTGVLSEVIPADPATYLSNLGRSWHTTVALFGAASFLEPETVWHLARVAHTRAVFMHFRPEHGLPAQLQIALPEFAAESAAAARKLPGAETFTTGDYDVTVVTR